jgi:hypothetical protein
VEIELLGLTIRRSFWAAKLKSLLRKAAERTVNGLQRRSAAVSISFARQMPKLLGCRWIRCNMTGHRFVRV